VDHAEVTISILVIDLGERWQVEGNCEVQNARADIDALRAAAKWLVEEADNAVQAGPNADQPAG
jgi:hypothetical protein